MSRARMESAQRARRQRQNDRPGASLLAAGRLLAGGFLASLAACGGSEEPGGGPDAPQGSGERPGAPEPSAALAFVDATADSGIDFRITAGADPPRQILEVKGGGCALFDLENDGDLDVFFPNGSTLDSPGRGPGARLYANQGEARFADRSAELELDFDRWGQGVAVGDANGDGFDDLYVTAFGANALLWNRDGLRLESSAQAAGSEEEWSTGCAFGDLDRDGDLDLYVVNYLEFDPEQPPEPTSYFEVPVFRGPMTLTAQADRAWENDGSGGFRERTEAWGMRAVTPSYGLGAVVVDLDLDGWQDVFVGNDSMPNFVFQGSEQGFSDASSSSGLASNQDGQNQATMGIALGDLNEDGAPDVFTTNFERDTNTLHLSRSGMRFRDRTGPHGLGAPSKMSLGWSAGFQDFDHDGDEDLLVFNGHVYGADIASQLEARRAQAPLLFERSGARFEPVGGPEHGAWLSEAHVDRGAAFGDLDRDGDVDVVVTAMDSPVRVLENVGASGPWLVVALSDSTGANPRGLGARLRIQSGELVQTRWILSGTSFLSASAAEAHCGFPAGSPPASVEVHWPDGTITLRSGVSLSQRLVIER